MKKALKALVAVLDQYDLKTKFASGLANGDVYVSETHGVVTVKASSAEQGSGPRPSRYTYAVEDMSGKTHIEEYEDVAPHVVVIVPKS